MDLREANTVTRDLLFRKIGVDIPLNGGSQAFSEQTPARALAVSNQFGIAFFANSTGFSVTKTSTLVQLAQHLKDGADDKTAQDDCYLSLSVPDIHLLSLSRDELTLAVCTGEHSIELYDVPTLIHKLDKNPFETTNVPGGFAKDLGWSPADNGIYLFLSSQGQLFRGQIGANQKCLVERGVVAASWSPDGKHVAYATEGRSLHIATSNFESSFVLELPAQLSEDDNNLQLHVESIRWVRPDSLLVSYIRSNKDGEEDDCPLFLLTSRNGDLAKEGGGTEGVVFCHLFPSTDPSVSPTGIGPFMLAEYLESWKMVVAANRRSVDDHIVTVGWLSEEGPLQAYNIELSNDAWVPRIELQENGDDNVLLGLALDRTTVDLQLADPRDDSGDTKLPPCPILVCLSFGGKLSLFSIARLDKIDKVQELVSPPSAIPESQRGRPVSPGTIEVGITSAHSQPASKVPPDMLQTNNRLSEAAIKVVTTPTQTQQASKVAPDINTQSLASIEMTATPTQSELAGKVPPDILQSEVPSIVVAATPAKSPQASKVPPDMLQTSNKPAEEPVEEDTSFSSASESDRGEDDQTDEEEVPSHFADKPGKLMRAESNSSSDQESESASPNDIPPPSSRLQIHPAPALSIVASSKPASVAPLRAIKSAPAGVGQIQSMGPAFEQPTLVAKPVSGSISQVQLPAGQRSSILSNTGQRQALMHSTGLSGQASNDKGSGARTSTSSAFSQPPPVQVERSIQTGSGLTKTSETLERVATTTAAMSRPSGFSDMEAAFILELQEVKRMGDEVDKLMAYIEGRSEKVRDNEGFTFTEQSLEELELGVCSLGDSCRRIREGLEEERQGIESLQDESVRVNAWRIYAQSLAKQAADNRHRQLWSQQKLPPDLDAKRRRVFMAEQVLKEQIAGLEEHVHHLELDYRRRLIGPKGGQINHSSRLSKGQGQSVQNVYNTVNGLLASAECLSQRITQQMESLNISTQPATASKILKSVGLSIDNVSLPVRPALNGVASRPHARHQLTYSPSARPASRTTSLATPPRRSLTADPGIGAPSTTRRRRDSIDVVRIQMGGTSPKTTMKRMPHIVFTQQLVPPSVTSVSPANQGRLRSSQDSSDEGTAQPRHVKRIQSIQMSSTSSSSTPSAFLSSSENKAFFSSGGASSTSISAPQRSLSPSAWQDQQSLDGRPEAKRTMSRGPLSFADNSAQTFASSRFGPAPSSITPTPTLIPTSVAAFTSNPPTESLFKWANSRSPTSASSFSYVCTSAAGRASTASAVDRAIPSGTPTSISGSGAGMVLSTPSVSSGFTSVGFGSNQTLGIQASGKPGSESMPSISNFSSESNLRPGFQSAKPEKADFGAKSTSAGAIPLSSATPFEGGTSASSLVQEAIGGQTATASTMSSIAFPLNNREELPEAKSKETKVVVPTTPNAQAVFEQKDLSKAVTSLGVRLPTLPSVSMAPAIVVIPPAADKPVSLLSQFIPIPVSSQSPISPQAGPPSSPLGVENQGMLATAAPKTQFMFPAATSSASSLTPAPTTATDLEEEDMEEEPISIGSSGFAGLGGLGLGSTPLAATAPKSNPFGGPSPFASQQSSPSFSLVPPPQGQLFRPATFNLPSVQSSPQASGASPFGSGFGSAAGNPVSGSLFSANSAAVSPGFGNPTQPGVGGFGQPSQLGPGQQALGTALGAFGQTRQMGAGLASPFGGGLGSAMGGGFASAATGGGFASAATGGGFAGAATASGFANVASGAAGGGGFKAFSGNQGGGGGFGTFAGAAGPGFGGSQTTPNPTPLFTQMRR